MRQFEINKLVRDKIVDKIAQNPLNVVEVEELSGEEKLKVLVEKFREESAELDTEDLNGLRSELADIQSLINASIRELGINKAEFELQVEEKDRLAGSFEKGLFLKRVNLDNNDEWVSYYEKKFKEIK